MKSFFQITAIFLLSISGLSAQEFIAGLVTDRESGEPLSYVNIGIKDSKIGTVSNDNGKFELEVESSDAIMVFSYLGYEDKAILIKDISGKEVVELVPKLYEIDEVKIVSSNLSEECLLGVRNKKRGPSIAFGNAQKGTELGAAIRIEKETWVKSINFVLNHAKGDSLLLRVNIYDFKNNKVGEKILKENLYVKDKQRKGLYSIDVREYDIILTNNVLVSLEWLRDFDELGNKGMTFDTKKSRKMGGTYMRNSKTSKFFKIPIKRKYKPCIHLIGNQTTKS